MADAPLTVCLGSESTAKCVVITNVKAAAVADIADATKVDAISLAGFRSGAFYGTTGTKTIKYYGSNAKAGTYALIASNANGAITINATSGSAIPFRDEVFKFAWLKLIHEDAAVTDIVVTLKS